MPRPLDARQLELLRRWLPDAVVVADLSWGLVERAVLELRAGDGARYILKAGGEDDHHIAREVTAHRRWVGVLSEIGRAPSLLEADVEARLLVTSFLPGSLVEGTPPETEAETYRQAGRLLRVFHEQEAVGDQGEYERTQQRETLAWLDRPHRIPSVQVDALRHSITRWPAPPSTLVPTHGDWQPRNWVVSEGTVGVIDFGRAALRPAYSDLARLFAQQLRGEPALAAAFFDGYGADPREPSAWLRLRVREAVGTASWAHSVGDDVFERQGLRMVEDVLAELEAADSARTTW